MRSLLERIFKPEGNKVDYLIVGLGNPGREYRMNRHNVGFLAVDYLCQKFKISITRHQFKSLYGQGIVNDSRLLLAKPTTFMNLSGQAVWPMVRFYKVEQTNLLILHDDMDLPLGKIRIRSSGGSGGQKGLASIIDSMGTQNVPRIRIGIGRPPGRMQPRGYVLENFSAKEQELLAVVFDTVANAVSTWMTEGIESAMTRYNGSSANE